MSEPVSVEGARKWWLARNGLAGAAPTLEAAARSAGWLHAIGGVDAYVSLRARFKDAPKADFDKLLETHRVVIGARGCTMMVPEDEAGVATRLGSMFREKGRQRDMEKVGVTPAERRKLGEAVLEILQSGACSTTGMRKGLPDGLARSLGDAGKKIGISSTLPLALRDLELEGHICRQPVDSRLDVERYAWRLDASPPELPSEQEAIEALLRITLAHGAPMTVNDLAAFSGVGKRLLKGALDAMGAESVEVDGFKHPAFSLKGQADGLLEASPPAGVHFLPIRDPYLDVRESLACLVHPKFHGLTLDLGPRGGKPLGQTARIFFRTLLVDGRIVGLWEFDEETQSVAWGLFESLPAKRKEQVGKEADALGKWMAETLGHAKVYPADSPRYRAQRVEAVQKLDT